MKRFFNVLAITLACVFAIGMTACEGGTGGGGLTVNPGTLEFAWAGGSEYVTVSGSDWTVTASAGITAVKEGNSVKVTVAASTANKNGTVTISNGSDTKTVTVNQLLKADDLVGTWNAVEYFYVSGDGGGFYNNNHNIYMTKVNANTVKATNVLWWAETEDGGDIINITVNADGTITIPAQAMQINESSSGLPIHLVRFKNSIFSDTTPPGSYAENWGIGWDNLSVNGYSIDLGTGGYNWEPLATNAGIPYAHMSYHGAIKDDNNVIGQGAGKIFGFSWFGVNTVWTKASASPAPMVVPSSEPRPERDMTLQTMSVSQF